MWFTFLLFLTVQSYDDLNYLPREIKNLENISIFALSKRTKF